MKNDLVIYHKKKLIYVWLTIGGAMLILGIGGYIFNDGDELDFSLGLGIFYFIAGIYYAYKPYVKVRKNILRVSTHPFRKINLNQLESVKQFLDETTLISEGKETLISNQQMSDEDIELFQEFVENLQPIKKEEELTSLT